MSAPRSLALPRGKALSTQSAQRVYRARVVNSGYTEIIVKPVRTLTVGKRITFLQVTELKAGRVKVNDPKWRSAVIWRIDNGCLHLTRT